MFTRFFGGGGAVGEGGNDILAGTCQLQLTK